MEVAVIIKALAWIVGVLGVLWSVLHYGGLKEEKGRQKGISEAREANDKNYTELADDVLDGGHPYGVRDGRVAEITRPNPDPGARMATDLRPEGETDRLARDRNGST